MNEELELFGQLVSGRVSGFSIGNFFIPTHTVVSVLALSLVLSSILSVVLSIVLVNYTLYDEYKKVDKIIKILMVLIIFEFLGDLVLLMFAK